MMIDISKADHHLRGSIAPALASAVKDNLEHKLARREHGLRPRDIIYAAYEIANDIWQKSQRGHPAAFSPAEAFRATLKAIGGKDAHSGQDREDVHTALLLIASSYLPRSISKNDWRWLSSSDVDVQKSENLHEKVAKETGCSFAKMQQAKCLLHRVQHTEMSAKEQAERISEAWSILSRAEGEPRAAKLMGDLLLKGITPYPGYVNTQTLYPRPSPTDATKPVFPGNPRLIHEAPDAEKLYVKAKEWHLLGELFTHSAKHLVKQGDMAGARSAALKSLDYCDKGLIAGGRHSVIGQFTLRKMAANAYTALSIDAPPDVDTYDINWQKEYATAAAVVTYCYERGVGVQQDAEVVRLLSHNTRCCFHPTANARDWDAWVAEARQSLDCAIAKRDGVQAIESLSPAKPASSPKKITDRAPSGDGVMVSPVALHNAIAQATTNSKPTRQGLSR